MPFAYYSSTQQKKFTLCPRRYYYHYFSSECGSEKEEVGIPAIYSRAVLHRALQSVHSATDTASIVQALWETYVAEVGLLNSAHTLCTLPLAEKATAKYARLVRAWEEEKWECVGVEREFILEPPFTERTRYKTRVDVVLKRGDMMVPVDYKFTTYKYGFDSQLWTYDPQIVGHAACMGVEDAWVIEIVAREATKNRGATVDVKVVPIIVPRREREQWLWERVEEVQRRDSYEERRQWPRVTGACRAFGKPCPYIEECLGNG